MQINRHAPGGHPNSRKNLVLTEAQRKENHRKIAETRRKNHDIYMEKLWRRAVELQMMDKTGPVIASALGVSTSAALRMKRWAKNRVDTVG